MEKLALCRICLTSNVSSINIINHELQEIYHKLTSLAFKTEDRRPHLVCCFCKSLLRKALSLKIDSLAAERVFSHILDSEDLSLIDFDIPANCSFPRLRKETQQSVSIDTACEELTGQIADSDLGKIKHEVIDENDPLSECDDNEDELALIDFDQRSSKVGVKKESGSNKYEKFYTKRRKGQVADELPPVNIDDECLKGVKAESELNICEVSPHSKLSIEIAEPFAGKDKLDPIHTEPYSYQESDDIEPHQSKEYKCHLCPRTYRFQSALKRHILMHTGERPFKCGNCHRTFAENSNMLKHIRNRHPEVVSFTCHKCHKVFKDSASLKEHRLTHTGDGAHKCDICQKGFKRKTQLKEHLLTHGPKPYMCDHCQKRFKNRNFLQNHVRIAHTQEKRYKCDKCHLAFKQSHQLKVHKYTHAGKKPYKCDLCEKDFSYKGVLINHMKIHSGEKPFKCDKCWKDFRQLAQLTTHIRIHSGVRPYKCKMCMKSFKQQSDMKKHARIHTGERPYKCDVCGRDFVQRHACVIHMRSHTGEKPYHCSVCQKSFICHSRLKRHSMVHTGDRPYNCHLCEKEFKEKPTLRRHIRRVHNTEMNQNKLKNVL